MSVSAREVQNAIEDNDLFSEYSGKMHPVSKDHSNFWTEFGEYTVYIGDFAKTEPVLSEREDEYWVVIFKIGEQYFRLLGDYDSWNGTEWWGATVDEVIPRQITKTVYDKVK